MLHPFNRNKEAALKGVAVNFGKDLANSFVPGVFPGKAPGRRRRMVSHKGRC
jgi:hypothetical protein